jgi:hypothetical protein
MVCSEDFILDSQFNNHTGPIARIGPNTLVTSSPDFVMRMGAARSPYTKADWYRASRIPPGEDNIFTQQDEEKHARRRAQMADGVCQQFSSLSQPLTDQS